MDRDLVQSVNVMPLILIFLVVSKGVTWDKEKKNSYKLSPNLYRVPWHACVKFPQ